MTGKSNIISQKRTTESSSFARRTSFLCIALLLFCSQNLLAQVINNTGAVISVAGAVVGTKDLENTSGTLGNNGTINLSGNYFNQGTNSGNGYYNLRGQWTNNGSFIPGTSTVTLYGTVNQTINNNSAGETFYNLIINNPGSVITQIANAGNTLGVLNNLTLTAGTLSLHSTTAALSVGGRATINGSLIFNNITTQTATIGDILSGPGTIDMSWGNLPHLLNLAGATNAIGTFTTSPTGASTVNYNGTGPTQTVFAAPNYRNLIISNSGIKTLQGSSVVGINLTINGGTFDLGTSATALDVAGNTSITGSMSFNGTTTKIVTLNGSLSGAGGIDMSGGNLLHFLNLNGSSNTIGSYLSGTGSTVKYTLNGDQSVFSSDNYRNLTITGTGVKTIYSDISASGILTMSAGDINSNGNTLKITNPSVAAIVRTTGTVIGKLQRAIGNPTGSEYLYPIGTGTFYNPLKIKFRNLISGPLTAQFLPDDIGTIGLPLDDDGNEIFDRYTTGYWSLTSVSPMASGDYSVNLNYTGFPGGIDQSASIIKRTDGGNLELDGVHGIISSPEITRDTLEKGISSTTTDLAIGKGRPRIVRQPENIDICDSSNAFFEVTARGRGTLTYQWQVSVNGGSTFNNIIDGGVYSGAETKKLTLTGAVYSMNQYLYRCIITDAQGHPNTTYPALLTVNKIPVATASPTSQNECPGVAFTNILLGTFNDVPGTTFEWSRSAPSGITTNLPLTGSATGDMITGTFTNTTDAPVTVIFNIIPTGPATTFCIGHQISVSVTVNPKPKVLAMPPNAIQCDSTTTSIRLTSPSVFTSGVITFKYTVTTTGDAGSVTGYTTPTSNIAKDAFITDKLINHTDVYQIVTYRVVPVSPVGCIDGDALEVKVTVNPTPRAIPVILSPEICYGGLTNIVLTTPTVMTSGVIKFDYTISFTGVPGDVTGNSASASDLTPGQTLAFQYWNSAPPSRIDTVSSVLFAIRPKVVGLGCNAGRINIAEVKVHPKTIKYNYPATNGTGILITKPLTCDISSGLAALKVILTAGADPYHISWTGPVNYSNDSVEIKNLYNGKYTVTVTDNLGCTNDSSIYVVPFTARPQIVALPILPNIHVSCPGGNDGSIRVYVSSGITAPYYFWVTRNNGTGVDTLFNGVFTGNYNPTDPNTFKLYNNLKAGIYMIILSDVNGCIVLRTTELKEPAPITNIFQTSKEIYNGYDVSCLGYSNGYAVAQTTGGNGSYSYLWYPATGTLTVSTTTNMLDSVRAGKYYLRTTDYMGCVKVDSVILTEPSGMVLTGSVLSVKPDGVSNISCNGGNDGSIQITISGGSGEYLYSWTSSNGFIANTKDISGLKAGSYTCTVSDVNGCLLTPTPVYTLVEPTPLVITGTPSKSDDGSFNINCNGGTGAVNISVAGGSLTGYSYTWSTSDGSGIIAGQEDQPSLTVGTYILLVRDLNGCETQAEYTLTQPPSFGLVLSATNITCQAPGFNNGSIDLSVSGGVAPYNYSWSNGSVNEDVNGLTEGYYHVTVTYNNTCSKSDSVRINMPPLLTYTKTLSDYNGYNISCNGLTNGLIQINPTSGLAPFIYNWTGPDGFTATSQDLSNLRSGDYSLLITDSNYCTATENITLTEPGKLGMEINLSESTAGGFNLNCAGDTTGSISIEPLNQVKTVDYMWSDGLFGRTRINLPAGKYTVIIKDANNCYASSTITLTEPDSLKMAFDISQPLCPDMPDGEIRLNVTCGVPGTDYFYQWSDNSTNKVISNILKGFYKVTVRDLNGCSVKDSVRVEPLNETCLVIPNAISPNDDLINDVWNIGMIELYPNMEIKIFNRWGEIIWRSEKGYPKPWDGKSNGIPLPIDSYHYLIDLHNGTKPLVGNVTIVR